MIDIGAEMAMLLVNSPRSMLPNDKAWVGVPMTLRIQRRNPPTIDSIATNATVELTKRPVPGSLHPYELGRGIEPTFLAMPETAQTNDPKRNAGMIIDQDSVKVGALLSGAWLGFLICTPMSEILSVLE